MRIIRRKKHNETEEYWQPATDIMLGLLLVIILVMSLLLSYLARRDDKFKYDATHHTDQTTVDYSTTTYESTTRDYDDGGDGVKGETTTIIQAGGGGNPYNDQGKTAVLVSVVDEETGNIIKQSGIKFELYAERDANGGLQALYTYYPVKTEYKQYETDKNGRFYLPEKIVTGWYSLHNLTVPDEYEAGSNTDFEITKSQDWDDPFLVSVPLSPYKNVIRLNAVDSETGDPVAGGMYEIIADEDIVLLDGTVRLKDGEVADVLTCDKNGFAESQRLYLGKYRIRQKRANAYYALGGTVLNAEVQKAADTEIPVYESLCEKTQFIYTLTDDYTQEPIEGAVFTDENGQKLTTDEKGTILLTDLRKGQKHTLTLTQLPAPYRAGDLSASFAVDKKGLIKGKAKQTVSETAYAIRLSAAVEDLLLKQDVNDVNLTLYDRNDKVVQNWDSNGTDRIIEGLEPGMYQLEIAGRASSRISFEVKDAGGLQHAAIYLWTAMDSVLVLVAAALLAVLVLVAVRIVRRKKKVKSDAQ